MQCQTCFSDHLLKEIQKGALNKRFLFIQSAIALPFYLLLRPIITIEI